ncbi:Serine/threonine-protein kinase Nek2 [Kappamyces sp. JEL0680]|nr:Serine/threonine-protein kinase Nek2 [Kappamyces sp. JEL0680]
MSEKEKIQLVAEVNILRELKHNNIVRYYERFVDREQCLIYIIMGMCKKRCIYAIEYCEGGDLAAVIKRCQKEKRYIPEDVVWNLFAQLIQALHECHKSASHAMILHRDIKPSLNVKLGDFGLSRTINDPEQDFAKTYVGTPFYMSPELVDSARYNSKSDMWALGCLIYELCCLEPPFISKTQSGLIDKIKEGRISPLPNHYSSELEEAVRSLFALRHESRPDSDYFLRHPRIRLALKEQELANMKERLRQREDDVAKRQSLVEAKELALRQLESELKRRENDLLSRESEFQLRVQNHLGRSSPTHFSPQKENLDVTMFVSPAPPPHSDKKNYDPVLQSPTANLSKIAITSPAKSINYADGKGLKIMRGRVFQLRSQH